MYKIKNLNSNRYFVQIGTHYCWGYGDIFKTFEDAKQKQSDFCLSNSAIVEVK